MSEAKVLSATMPAAAAAAGPAHAHYCGNCEAPLGGPFCASCGQHAHASARHLGAVVHDAWHDITHVDGRIWHSLWLLLSRPGYLTCEYFAERRARYLPPVRLYLVVSLVFFSFGLGNPNVKIPAPHAAGSPAAAQTTVPATGVELAPPGRARQSAPAVEDAPAEARSAGALLSAAQPVAEEAEDKLTCAGVTFSGSRSIEAKLREACEGMRADNGAAYLRTLTHNVPKMMFVFLPLVAALMLGLYWRPRRYYVEHLVFLLHNHSALFLCFVLLSLIGLLGRVLAPLAALVPFAGLVAFCYAAWYPYAAMRRYYRQGRTLTLAKYAALGFAYFLSLLLTLLGTAVLTAVEG